MTSDSYTSDNLTPAVYATDGHKTTCLLTLSFPKKIRPEVTDSVRQMSQYINGFTVVAAEGYGDHQKYHTALEKVKGSTDRSLLLIVIATDYVEPILEILKQQYTRVDMYYWVTPVSHTGYF